MIFKWDFGTTTQNSHMQRVWLTPSPGGQLTDSRIICFGSMASHKITWSNHKEQATQRFFVRIRLHNLAGHDDLNWEFIDISLWIHPNLKFHVRMEMQKSI